jgi:peroxiredoxin
MSKQWILVLTIVGGLALGAFALTRLAPRENAVELGRVTPDFTVLDLATGDTVTLRTRYKGHVTLVNIWATWCVPCKTEMPAMQQAFEKFQARGFRVAAVSIDEGSSAPVTAFAKDLGLTFDVLHDPTTLIKETYQTTGVPESFLLDQDGTLVKRVIGAYDWASPASAKLLERTLDAAGATPVAAP